LRFLDEPTLAASAIFPRDRPRRELEPSTLDRPRIVDDMRKGYER
jgi:spermidine synthase